MADGNKTINMLTVDELFEALDYCGYDPYYDSLRKPVISEIRRRLKKQKPVEPITASDEMECTWYYVCPKCKIAIDYKDKYCRH